MSPEEEQLAAAAQGVSNALACYADAYRNLPPQDPPGLLAVTGWVAAFTVVNLESGASEVHHASSEELALTERLGLAEIVRYHARRCLADSHITYGDDEG